MLDSSHHDGRNSGNAMMFAAGPTATTSESVKPASREEATLAKIAAEPTWSDRRIAEACGVSPKLVARLRASVDPSPQHAKRVGRDGRFRPMPTGVHHDRILEALAARPGASLRTIAAEVGVSPETVRTVKRSATVRLTTTTAVAVQEPVEEPSIPEALAPLLFFAPHRPPAPNWRQDRAFDSTPDASDFREWFERTVVEGHVRTRVAAVPLSRTYEIADEARRRAEWWRELAEQLEGQVRRRVI